MTATEDLHRMDRALKERDEQLHILKGRLAENQRKIADYQRNFAIMEVEIQRCNAEIIKKNSEILTFKNAANANSSEISSQSDQKEQQLKVAEMQMDQLKENIKSK
jgi:septal ring factor EnvC (AmiA/AmiB activator)